MRKDRIWKGRRPDAILTGDWHLRETTPLCRTDDFMQTQWRKIEWLKDLRHSIYKIHSYEPPILNAGDLFDRWRATPWFLSKCIERIPPMYIVAGNHDLPAHSLSRLDESALYVMAASNKIHLMVNGEPAENNEWGFVVVPFIFGEPLTPVPEAVKRKSQPCVALIHHYVYKGRKPYPGATGGVEGVMRKLHGFDLILSGDNHLPFAHKNRAGQLLVNPGSFTRQIADQINHRPRVYLWYKDTNEIEEIHVPIEIGVINREHIDGQKERDDRIILFIERLLGDFEAGVTFESNMDLFLKEKQISKRIEQKIREAMER